MKTIKEALLFLLSITMITMLFDCSSQNDMTDINIGYLSNELLEKAEFEDELNAVDDTIIKKLYNINDYLKASVQLLKKLLCLNLTARTLLQMV